MADCVHHGAVNVRLGHLETRADRVEVQVEALQQLRWKALGAIGAVVVIGSMLTQLLFWYLPSPRTDSTTHPAPTRVESTVASPNH